METSILFPRETTESPDQNSVSHSNAKSAYKLFWKSQSNIKVFPEVQSYNTARLKIVRKKIMGDKRAYWEESTLVV